MIYLDSAATSMLKPDTVQYAVIDAMSNMASPGRGAHAAAMKAAETCFACREKLARLFNAPEPDNVVFTFNATHALNIAINSLAGRKSRVLISGYEHNSVTRPLKASGAQVITAASPLFDRDAFLASALEGLERADVCVCTHVSNVFGFILPVEELAAACRDRGVPLIIDASQSAGALKLDFQSLGADFVAMPGHKGLMGPQGTGVLLCKNEAKPLLYGGSGSQSRLEDMPPFLPDRLEAGTHNVCGIAGLSAALDYILDAGTEKIRTHERQLLELMAGELAECGQLKLFYSPDPAAQCGVLSLQPENMSCEELGERLGENGVAVRTGLHCAPAAHRSAGTDDRGTVRLSFSPFNCREEIISAGKIIKNAVKKAV